MSQSLTSVVARPAPGGSTDARPGRTLRVVTAAENQGSARFPVLCALLLLAGLAAVLGLNTVMAQDSFAVARLEARSAELTDTQESLTHDLDRRSAPQELADRAYDLGMVPAGSAAFIDLQQGKVLGVAKTARAVDRRTVNASASPTPRSSSTKGAAVKTNSETRDRATSTAAGGAGAEATTGATGAATATGATGAPTEKAAAPSSTSIPATTATQGATTPGAATASTTTAVQD